MTPKKNYSRYFIILQEDEKGYSLDSDKIPSGYAKLEMKNNKCKISYYVQNLRKEKQPYYMILICGKKDVNKIIKLGKLNIDDYGRVDISHEYDMDNIADTGIPAEKIIGAAIVKFLDTNVISIMSGFSTSDKPNEWKNYKLADGDKEKKETRQDDVINEFDEYEKNIELIKLKSDEETDRVVENLEIQEKLDEGIEVKQRTIFEDVEKVEILENIEKVEVLENIVTPESVEILERLDEKIEVIEPNYDLDLNRHKNKKEDKEEKEIDCSDNKVNNDKEEYPKGSIEDFFKGAAQGFEETPNFTKELKWCKWYKVPVGSLEDLYDLSDYNKYAVAYYPMICYYPYIRNHKSYMLGYKSDSSGKMKYIVYAIPGTKSKAHQPCGGRTGFVTWISGKEDDGMGHWLMFYDFKNSTIVVPFKK
ncbi:hypothetical protein LGK97_18530 [Clostridium sp. CS001]|uniref:DUF7922 domain-containing protein n=1 Tax=Clostridium sp. CS001 TaxID=2880648 RepID=UPI001CF465FD|nr:hypothetical protein [Clostridium sp. CS001]MCB2291712.1 hypothetical protein [Clostridium sp. CS001]